MAAVHSHVLALAGRGKEELRETVSRQLHDRLFSEAKAQLQSMDIGPTSYYMILRVLVENEVHFGKNTKLECTRAALHGLCMVCFGGIPLGRTRAHFEYKKQLENAGITGNFRKACLYCQVSRKVCVLESEWHFLLFCIILPTFHRFTSG